MSKLLVPLVVWSLVVCMLLIGCASTPVKSTATDDRSIASGDELAGKASYDTNCASCHKLGKYDTEGRGNLSGDDDDVTVSFVAKHADVSMSEAEVAQLRAFIASY